MTPRPLSHRVFCDPEPEGCGCNTEHYHKEEVASAVAWLKNKIKEQEDPIFENSVSCTAVQLWIDEAFGLSTACGSCAVSNPDQPSCKDIKKEEVRN